MYTDHNDKKCGKECTRKDHQNHHTCTTNIRTAQSEPYTNTDPQEEGKWSSIPDNYVHNKRVDTRSGTQSSDPISNPKKKKCKCGSQTHQRISSKKCPFYKGTQTRGKRKWYAIAKGRQTGVFNDYWEFIEPLVREFSNKKHKSFATKSEAVEWLSETWERTISDITKNMNIVDGTQRRNTKSNNKKRQLGKTDSVRSNNKQRRTMTDGQLDCTQQSQLSGVKRNAFHILKENQGKMGGKKKRRTARHDTTESRNNSTLETVKGWNFNPRSLLCELFIKGNNLKEHTIRSILQDSVNPLYRKLVNELKLTQINRNVYRGTVSGHRARNLEKHLCTDDLELPFQISSFEENTHSNNEQGWKTHSGQKTKCIEFVIKCTSTKRSGKLEDRIRVMEALDNRWWKELTNMKMQMHRDHEYICQVWTKSPYEFCTALKDIRNIRKNSRCSWRAAIFGSSRKYNKNSTKYKQSKLQDKQKQKPQVKHREGKQITSVQNSFDALQKKYIDEDDERESHEEPEIKPHQTAIRKPRIYIKNKCGLRVATWNAGIIGRHTHEEINQYCLDKKIMIMCIQESGATQHVKPKFKDYHWFDQYDKKIKNHSMGIMVRKTILSSVDDITSEMKCTSCRSSECVSSQWIKIRTHQSNHEVVVIGNYYVPNPNETPGNKTKRAKTLSGIRNKIKHVKHVVHGDPDTKDAVIKIMMCGDFNLHMGKTESDHDNPLMGNYMFHDSPTLVKRDADECEHIRSIMKREELVCLNGHKEIYDTISDDENYCGKAFTRIGKKDDKLTHTVVDYIFTNCQCKPMEITQCPMKGDSRMSDHEVLYTDIKISVEHRTNKRDYTKYLKLKDFYDHTNPGSKDNEDIKHKEKVERNVKTAELKLRKMQIEEKIKELCRRQGPSVAYNFLFRNIVKVLEEVCGSKIKGTGKVKSWWTSEYGKKSKNFRKLGKSLRMRQTSRNSHKWKEYRKVGKSLKALRRRLIREFEKERGNTWRKMYLRNDKAVYRIHEDLNKYSESLNITSLIDKKDDNRLKTDHSDMLRIAEDHGVTVFQEKINTSQASDYKPTITEHNINKQLVKTITPDEVQKAINAANLGRAPGPEDRLNAEVFKSLGHYLAPILAIIFNAVIRTGEIPRIWRKGTIVNLFKNKGSRTDLNNYRGIMLLSITGKLFNSILAKRITKHCVDEKVINTQQAGFMPGEGTIGHAMVFTEIVRNMVNDDKRPFAFFLDLSKAFDCIPRHHIYNNMAKAGIPEKLINVVKDMYDKTEARFRVNNEHTNYINTIQGVPQGDPLSPIIFNIVINPLLEALQKKNIAYKFVRNDNNAHSFLMYADDFVLLAENEEQLQEGIEVCKECIDYLGLKANVKKSAVMQFTMGEEKSQYKFKWGENEIPFNGENKNTKIDSYQYLGITIDKDLTWEEHFDNVRKRECSAFSKFKTTLEHMEMPVTLKLKLAKSCIATTNKYGIEVTSPSDKVIEKLDEREMKYLKTLLDVHPHCGSTFLRLLCNWPEYELTREVQTINTLRKFDAKGANKYQSKLPAVWQNNYDIKFRSHNSAKQIIESKAMWLHDECSMIYDHSEGAKIKTYRNSMHRYKEKLQKALKKKTRYISAVRNYENEHHGRDPILTYLTPRQTRRWVNIVAGGYELGWKPHQHCCPHCGSPDSIEHTFKECKHLKDHEKQALDISLESKSATKTYQKHQNKTDGMERRVKAVKTIIGIDVKRERKVMLNMINEQTDITGKTIKINVPNDKVKSGKILAYDPATTTASIELEGGGYEFVNIKELISRQHCWIFELHKFLHPPHQTWPSGQVTVRRADGQNMADST